MSETTGFIAPVDGALRAVENLLAVIAGAVLAGTMVLVTTDAVSRHLFSAPLTFQFTLTESYLMVAGIALALPWGYRAGGRIRIALLLATLPPQVQHLLFRIGNIIALPYLAVLCWLSAEKTYTAFANQEYTMGIIDWPVGWSWIWVPIGLAVLTLRVFVDTLRPVVAADLSEH
ncbi:TRAP transporter small permease [Acuticoccus mangrovi]|uniref:TRAP transporter small permease protein n=1 Tax=Acuticoccus mangrovi TaxID=2796142 RepID=A0A934MDY7_9HYPH|nr:TRAP transporter small permease [Acuticoccus mangrovi]MBJ3776907.1 TRAP transporter small permease [Acuticoccus mangrovi]